LQGDYGSPKNKKVHIIFVVRLYQKAQKNINKEKSPAWISIIQITGDFF